MLVVVDNGGGGIFSFLPQASALEAAYFQRLFGTPQIRRRQPRQGHGVRTDEGDIPAGGCRPSSTQRSTTGARRGPAVVVVRTDRKANVALHAEIEAEVALALA